MQVTRQRDTPGELELRAELRALGIRYRVDMLLPGTRRRADVAFVRAKVAVFVDGCFWHGCPMHGTWPKNNAEWWRQKIEGNRARDLDTDRRLVESGWMVVRIWAHENMSEQAASIANAVRARRTE